MRTEPRTPRRSQPDAAAVLAGAALLGLIARGFGYPAPGNGSTMRDGFAGLDGARARGAFEASLDAAIERAKRAWHDVEDEAEGAEYIRLFHGAAQVSLRETAYGDGRRPAGRPVELADINGFYLAFGVEPAEANPDMPDHISVELEFLSLMLVKEAYALICGRQAEYRLTRKAARAFVEDHLGRWLPSLCRRLEEEAAAPCYRELGALLAAVLAAECRRLGAKPMPTQGPAAIDEMQAETFTCPLAAPTAGSSPPDDGGPSRAA